MKKLFLTTLAMLGSTAAYALPVGNPCEASLLNRGLFWDRSCNDCDVCDPCFFDSFSFRLGFYGDYVFNRNLMIRVGDDEEGQKIEHTKIYTNAAYFAFNFCNRADIFATVGTTKLFFDTNVATLSATPVNSRFEIETTDACPSWSVGGRVSLWEWGCTCLGIEGQYFRARNRLKRATLAEVASTYPDDFFRTTYREWQVGFGLSHRISCFVPYVAVKWAGARWDFPVLTDLPLPNLENHKRWGYAIGCSLVDCDIMALTVEGRWADEKALYVNGQIRF